MHFEPRDASAEQLPRASHEAGSDASSLPTTPSTPASSEPIIGRRLYLLALAFAWSLARPVRWLVGVVPDDAFYYLKIARNLATHGLSSFDGINATNGYHPGWMLLMTVCAKLFSTPQSLLRAALIVAFLFHVAGSALLVRALSHWVVRPWAELAGACWLLNPLPVRLALQGMEASFYVFGLTCAFLLYSARLKPVLQARGVVRTRDLRALGLCLALCFWGRTEAIVLSGAVMLAVIVAAASSWPARLRTAAALGIPFGLGIAPWFVFSFVATGSWTQRSGAMKLLWGAAAMPTASARLQQGVHYLSSSWLLNPWLFLQRWQEPNSYLSCLLALAVVLVLASGLRKPATRHAATVGLLLLASTLLLGCIYAFFFADHQEWYRAQPGLILYLVTYTAAAFTIRPLLPRAGIPVFVSALTLLSCVVLAKSLAANNPYPWQRDVFDSQPRFEARVPASEPIGSFNAGLPGYFSSRTIVNLDGLANNALYPYYASKTFERYLRDAGIHYVADESWSLDRARSFSHTPLQLRVLARAPLTAWSSGDRFLWQVVP